VHGMNYRKPIEQRTVRKRGNHGVVA